MDDAMKVRLLRAQVSELIQGYLRLLESARDRIMLHGGTCDSVSQMERDDPWLIKAKSILRATSDAGGAKHGE